MGKNQYNSALSKMDSSEIYAMYVNMLDFYDVVKDTKNQLDESNKKCDDLKKEQEDFQNKRFDIKNEIINLKKDINHYKQFKKSLSFFAFSKKRDCTYQIKEREDLILKLQNELLNLDESIRYATESIDYEERYANIVAMNYHSKQLIMASKLNEFKRRAKKVIEYVNRVSSPADKIDVNILVDFLQDKKDGNFADIIETSFEEKNENE